MSITKIRYGDEWVAISGYEEADIDDVISAVSTNPVQNKIVKEYVDGSLETYSDNNSAYIVECGSDE